MATPQTPETPQAPWPWRPRFSIGTMLMVMFIFCVMAAAGSYLVRSLRGNRGAGVLVFILFTLAAPMLLTVILSLLRWIIIRQKRRP